MRSGADLAPLGPVGALSGRQTSTKPNTGCQQYLQDALSQPLDMAANFPGAAGSFNPPCPPDMAIILLMSRMRLRMAEN